MSLDMTMERRVTDAEIVDESLFDEAAAPAERVWLHHLITVTATAFGVLFSSALGVLLFLR